MRFLRHCVAEQAGGWRGCWARVGARACSRRAAAQRRTALPRCQHAHAVDIKQGASPKAAPAPQATAQAAAAQITRPWALRVPDGARNVRIRVKVPYPRKLWLHAPRERAVALRPPLQARTFGLMVHRGVLVERQRRVKEAGAFGAQTESLRPRTTRRPSAPLPRCQR